VLPQRGAYEMADIHLILSSPDVVSEAETTGVAVQVLSAILTMVWPARSRPPRHPPQFRPLLLESGDLTARLGTYCPPLPPPRLRPSLLDSI